MYIKRLFSLLILGLSVSGFGVLFTAHNTQLSLGGGIACLASVLAFLGGLKIVSDHLKGA